MLAYSQRDRSAIAQSRKEVEMTARSPWRLLWILVGIVALIAVVGVAYYWGVNAGNKGAVGPFFGPRHELGMMAWSGFGWWGVIPALIVVFLLIFLFATLIGGPDRSRPPVGRPEAPGSAPQPGDVERLRELSELHERGSLTDDEFTAAKRKILGM